jgi:hypothetical protein
LFLVQTPGTTKEPMAWAHRLYRQVAVLHCLDSIPDLQARRNRSLGGCDRIAAFEQAYQAQADAAAHAREIAFVVLVSAAGVSQRQQEVFSIENRLRRAWTPVLGRSHDARCRSLQRAQPTQSHQANSL